MRPIFVIVFFTIAVLNIIVSGKTTTYVINKGEVVARENPEYEDIDDITEKNEHLKQELTVNYTSNGWNQGICDDKREPLVYTENFLLENDNHSEVTGTMQIAIGGGTNITCVEVINRDNSTQPPIYLKGGVFSSNIQVGVIPGYGKGFDFTVKLYGRF